MWRTKIEQTLGGERKQKITNTLGTKTIINPYINYRLNYSFGPSICHKILVWSSSFSLSQFGPHFLKNDSIWFSPLTLTRRC